MLECIYFFIIGAFVGWMLECVFKYVSGHMNNTPGILNTPFCILYGVGTAVLSLVINRITNNFVLLFLLSMLVLTIMEYVTFIILKKIYGVQLWDYSNMTLRLDEKVCLEFSLIWGILGAVYIKFLLPLLTKFLAVYKGAALTAVIYLLFGVIFVDFVVSSYILIRRKKVLEKA